MTVDVRAFRKFEDLRFIEGRNRGEIEIRKLLHCGKASGLDAAGYGIALAFANFDSGELLKVFFVAGVIRTAATR